MSELKRAALLLPYAYPKTQSEREAFAAQHLACQLYASNHDLIIVGLCNPVAGEAEDPGAVPASPDEPALPFVEPCDVDLVLAVAAPQDDAVSAQIAGALEQLREQQIDVVLLDR